MCLIHVFQNKLFEKTSEEHDIFQIFQKLMKKLNMNKKMNVPEMNGNPFGHHVRCVRGHIYALCSFLEVLHAAITEIEKITRLSSTCRRYFELYPTKKCNFFGPL